MSISSIPRLANLANKARQAGAFQGIPTYFNHAFTPLIEVQNARIQTAQN